MMVWFNSKYKSYDGVITAFVALGTLELICFTFHVKCNPFIRVVYPLHRRVQLLISSIYCQDQSL